MNPQVIAPPAGPAPDERIVVRLLDFLRFLRGNGFQVGVGEELDALRAAARENLLDARRLRWALRALLCSSRRDWERFEVLFDAYWRRPKRKGAIKVSGAAARSELTRGGGGAGRGELREMDGAGEGEGRDASENGRRGGASAEEVLQRTDFRFITEPGAMQALEALAERLARRMRRRLVRRRRIDARGRSLHLRRTLRKNLRYGGLPLDLVYRRRRRVLPRLVLLLDVSRSMSLYSYLFLRFARGLVGAFGDVEVFVFHTRLVHVTDALKDHDLGRMREKLAVLSLGWAGGTRIGEALRSFERDYGRRMLNRRCVVMIMSDGLDTGAPQRLAEALERIRRRARTVLWLNPLLGREGYAPLAGGMQAALPLVDHFLPAHDLQSLMALEQTLAGV